VRDDRRRAKAGDAVGGNGLRLDSRRQARLEHDLSREIGLSLLGHDDSEGERPDAGWIDVMPLEEAVHGVLRHREGAERGERLARLDERRACARDDRDATLGHGARSWKSMVIDTNKYAGGGRKSSDGAQSI